MSKLIAYTDGAYKHWTGVGGWAWALVKENCLVESFGAKSVNTTSNRMEYTALIDVIEKHGYLLEIIFTDSQLLVNTCNIWRHNWKQKEWKKKKGEIKNLDLVLKIDELLNRYEIKIEWVKAHNGNEWNELVDEIANNHAGIEDHFKYFGGKNN